MLRHPFLVAGIAFLIVALVVIAGYGFKGKSFNLNFFNSGNSPSNLFRGSNNRGETSGTSFETLKRGINSRETHAKQLSITDGGSLRELALYSLGEQFNNDPALSNVDFNKEMVLAVFQGQKPTGGYSVEITHVETSGDKIAVTVKEVSPGVNCNVIQAITSPYNLVRIARSNKPVVFAVASEVAKCK